MKYERGERIRYQPHNCSVCGKVHNPIVLDAEKFYRWKEDKECIQDVFPEMTEDQREILISGTCPECWKVLFPEEDEEVELEDSDPNDILTEEKEREKMDKFKAAVEIYNLREEYVWDQKDLEQRAKDMEQMELEDEAQRIQDMEEYNEFFDEENKFYCTDPFYPNNIFY